jgi:large subunit ribosomal protein L21
MVQQEKYDKYAIFANGGKQYQAIEGQTVAIEKIAGEAGDKIEIDTVLFRKLAEGQFEIGQPFLQGKITASIVKQTKDPKVIVFKFKRRKKVRVKNGHRQPKTVIRIELIA